MNLSPKTFPELLGKLDPNLTKIAFRFVDQTEAVLDSLSYEQLLQKSVSIACQMQRLDLIGQRVILLYPPGLEFITSYLGCLLAGVVAVPVSPPRRNRSRGFLLSISESCTPAAILTKSGENRALWDNDHRQAAAASGAKHEIGTWIETDQIKLVEDWRKSLDCIQSTANVTPDSLAFLQYTSGSTSEPKGVMITHQNLMANSQIIKDAFEGDSNDTGVCWLPAYHDMGLIGGVLQSIYVGGSTTLMAPAAFLQQPLRWLRTISNTRATISGGPDFAYDLCARKATEENCRDLDLSKWKVAFSGAEMVRAETLDKFAEVFGRYGFNPSAFYPCYGLAEATLLVSGGKSGVAPKRCTVDSTALRQNQAVLSSSDDPQSKVLVSSGGQRPEQKFVVVDPESFETQADGQVGEIWVQGSSVSQGYYNLPDLSENVFRAHTASGEGPFLRTGDLGFVNEGELYITGRIKDLILIRGQNHYPVDIEKTASSVDKNFRAGYCAAFTVEVDDKEQLVIAQEIEPRVRTFDHDTAMENIRRHVTGEHGVSVYAVVLLRAGDIPQTSSGKTQRFACRQNFINESWKPIAQWKHDPSRLANQISEQVVAQIESNVSSENPVSRTTSQIQTWLVDAIATRLLLPVQRIDPHAPFVELGLSSLDAVELTNDLSGWLSRELSPTAIYQFPTISHLASHLAGDFEKVAHTEEFKRKVQKPNSQTQPSEALQSSPARDEHEPIAIVGVGCRFPGNINSPETFWKVLSNGVDAITEVPTDRWNNDKYFDEDTLAPGKLGTKFGGFVSQANDFDAEFFGISPREAIRMDPQQRLLLEVTWEALERAGIVPSTLSGSRTGVYIGAIYSDYFLRQLGTYEDMDVFNGTGNSLAIAGNRLSYFLDVNGPSMTVDTACSSSLVTTHLAVQSLRSRETDLSIVGGVNLILGPEVTMVLTKAQMLSPDGRCKAFDAGANGYVRSEGCAIIVLKRLSDALANGDNIVGLIKGSSITHVGRSNGLSAPNGASQEMAMHDAMQNAGLQPSDIQYVEAHGTGTRLGDPVELDAIKNAYCRSEDRKAPLYVGSVKTNIGHTESSAGLAGLVKSLLILEHQQIPPHLHLQAPNPILHLEDNLVQIPTTNSTPCEIQNVGVSSFGFGGTNTHVILQRAPKVPANTQRDSSPQLVTLSAKSAAALELKAHELCDSLDESTYDVDLSDIAHTLNSGREPFEHRLAIRADSTKDLYAQLKRFTSNQPSSQIQAGSCSDAQRHKIAFLYTGQGSQYAGMGKVLYETEQVFKDAIDRCASMLESLSAEHNRSLQSNANIFAIPLIDALFDTASQSIDETGLTQPTVFAFQYALTQLWASWGIKPNAVIGHSLGEIAAIVTAGILSLEDGLKLVANRAALMQSLPKLGKMVAVICDELTVRGAIQAYDDRISIAAVNGPNNIVISGYDADIDAAVEHFVSIGKRCVQLTTSHAFHSKLMEPILEDLDSVAAKCTFQPPSMPVASNLTGTLVDDTIFSSGDYWSKHARNAVQFQTGFEALVQQGCDVFIEIGAQPILIGMANKIHREPGSVNWIASARRDQDDETSMLQAAGKLFVSGLDLDFVSRSKYCNAKIVSLPTYPFERREYFGGQTLLDRLQNGSATKQSSDVHPLLGQALKLPIPQTIFAQTLSSSHLPEGFKSARSNDDIVPTGSLLQSMLAAARTKHISGAANLKIDLVRFHRPLLISETSTKLQTVIEGHPNRQYSIQLHQLQNDDSTDSDFAKLLECQVSVVTSSGSLSSAALINSSSSLTNGHASTGSSSRPVANAKNDVFTLDRELVGSSDEKESQILNQAFDRLVSLASKNNEGRHWSIDSIDSIELINELSSVTSMEIELVHSSNDQASSHIRLLDKNQQCIGELSGVSVVANRADYLERLRNPVPRQWFKALNWHLAAIPTSSRFGKNLTILLIAQNDDIASAIRAQFQRDGLRCVTLLADGDSATYISNLRRHLAAKPDMVVDCSGIEIEPGVSLTSVDSSRTVYSSLLNLVHQMTIHRGEELKGHPWRLYVVTSNAQTVDDQAKDNQASSEPAIAQSLLLGFGRVMANEHPELRCTLVDLDLSVSESSAWRNLSHELLASSEEDQVAWRGSNRYAARLQDIAIDTELVAHPTQAGTSLITGGLGGLGLKLAQSLATQGVRSIVVVGRSKPNEGAQRVINDLVVQGVEVQVRQCDISKPEQIEELLSFVDDQMAPLDAIYHLAGVLDDGLIRDQSLPRLDKVLAAKVHGAVNLHNATLNRNLSKFVLFSSAAAMAGSPGQSNYAAGNAYLDALANHRRQLGLPAVSINWGSWSEVGMAAGLQAADHQRWASAGVGWIDPSRGMAALESIVESGVTQCAVMPMDWTRYCSRMAADFTPSWLRAIADEFAQSPAADKSHRPELLDKLASVPPQDQFETILQHFTSLAATTLAWQSAELPNANRTLNELGFDSLTGVEFCGAIGKSVGSKLSPTVLFDYPTIRGLAEHVAFNVLKIDASESQSADSEVDLETTKAENSVDDSSEFDVDMQAMDEIEAMSEAELEEMINAQLTALEGA